MKIFEYYDDNADKEYVWYSSDNLFYTEAMQNADKSINLKVVFSQGYTYLYNNVDFTDYQIVKNAQSNGKSFNIYIAKQIDGKPKYHYVRITDSSISDLQEKMNELEQIAQKKAEEHLKQQEEQQKSATIEQTIENIKSNSAKQTDNKVTLEYNKDENNLYVSVNNERVAKYKCDKEHYPSLALFISAIVSNLGGKLKIDVGD